MKVINFQIRNYKSIDDSKVCYLEKDMTIFAGKNESGKSSILEALNDFNYGKKISEDSLQINNEEVSPEIIVNLIMSVDEQISYFKSIGIDKKITRDFSFKLRKYFPNEYSFEDEALVHFELKDNSEKLSSELIKKVEHSYNELQELYDDYISSEINEFIDIDFDEIDYENAIEKVEDFKDEISKIDIEDLLDDKQIEIFNINLLTLEESISELIKIPNENLNSRTAKLLNKIPNFILFKSFEDDIPNKIPFSDLQKNDFIKDLEVISNFDKSILISGTDRKQSDHKEKINIEFNVEYKEFWTQDDTSFEFDWHDKNLLVWIKENGDRYKPTERSKGKQWHLSFYIRVTARSNESKDNIILIDEPGMYLHAKAQNDIYKKLLTISKKSQVIFTTHSPYLLKYDEIDRIRLVIKDSGETWINQKVHIGSDKETLTPILTSIGLELNTEIHSLDKLNNIVVEGPSDFYYLQAIKNIIEIKDINFIFGGGSTKMPFVGTILSGWGTKVLYLFDNDQGKKQGEKTLKNDWFVTDDEILSVIENKGSIEDIWSINFFKENVLNNSELEYNISNSEFTKKHSLDKVLIAKLFLSKSRTSKIKLDKESKTNIDTLIAKIKSKL